MTVYILLFLIVLLAALYCYWRFFWFFRDPERFTPRGNEKIIAPADGTIIYIKKITSDADLFSFKKGRRINLTEYCKDAKIAFPAYLIGTFMHPTSVHVNRAPISGKVVSVNHVNGTNLPMTITWWRTNLSLRPYAKYADHIVTNERNVIHIVGSIKATVIQIADIYVNRIESWVKPGDDVTRGKRIGMIKMGSQVDLVIPFEGIAVAVSVGQKVRAGETVLAESK